MRTSFALLPLLLTVAGACVINQSPPATSTDPTPPPGQTGAAPPPTTVKPPPTTTMMAPPTTTVTPPTTGAPGTVPPALIGGWISNACGTRKYVRKIQFEPAGKMEATDLVSPCPPKVACIWSGIVTNQGTYTVESGTIKVTLANPGKGPGSQAFPTTLAIDPATSAPIETADGARCVYAKDTGKN